MIIFYSRKVLMRQSHGSNHIRIRISLWFCHGFCLIFELEWRRCPLIEYYLQSRLFVFAFVITAIITIIMESTNRKQLILGSRLTFNHCFWSWKWVSVMHYTGKLAIYGKWKQLTRGKMFLGPKQWSSTKSKSN